MEKTFTHFFILAVSFFGTWFLLSRINFVGILHIEEMTREAEHRLGNLVLENIKRGYDDLESGTVHGTLDLIKHRLCGANGIKDSSVTIHVLVCSDVNAFALPDRHLVIYTGLIKYCNSAEELAGVMAHEISHMEHNHVMKKLTKEIGLAMLLTTAGGEAGGDVARSIVRTLTSTAFDREQEEEADASAVIMMAKADIDPAAFANFLFRLSQEKEDVPKHFELLSTHPNSSDRSAEILKLRKEVIYHPRSIISKSSWVMIKKIVNNEQNGKEEEE